MEDEVVGQEPKTPSTEQGEGQFVIGAVFGLIAATVIAACVYGSTIAPRASFYVPQKHTGPVRVVAGDMYHGFVMHRPNDEEFIMKFDSEVGFCFGLRFKDITYTDESRDVRHFIKATLDAKEVK